MTSFTVKGSSVYLAGSALSDRFTLRGWAGGYAIYDRGDLISTFHGPQFDLAAKTMRGLKDDAMRDLRIATGQVGELARVVEAEGVS